MMALIPRPVACSERIAASRPDPGPFTYTSMARRPCSMAFFAASSAAWLAAYGVLLRDPLNPTTPELLHERTLPSGSVMVTSVLLNVDWIYALPRGTCLRSRRLGRAPLRRSANLLPPRPLLLCR